MRSRNWRTVVVVSCISCTSAGLIIAGSARLKPGLRKGRARGGGLSIACRRGGWGRLGGGAGGGAGRGVLAGEPALGHADGRQVEEESQVAGNAEAPGVRVAVAVDEDEVRGVFEALEGAGQAGGFAER